MVFEKNPHADQKNTLNGVSDDTPVSFGEKLLYKISLAYESILFHERRALFLTLGIAIIVLFLGLGIYASKSQERASIASYEASKILEEIQSTDFSEEASLSERDSGNALPAKIQKKSLASSISILQNLSLQSTSALSKSSGVIAMGKLALQDTEKTLKNISLKEDIENSQEYFRDLNMDNWADFLSQMVLLDEGKTISVKNDASTPASKKQMLLQLYQDLLSPHLTPKEKATQAQLFFDRYPDLRMGLENAWGQKIQNFYQFLEKANGQHSSSSSKN